jgi:hypothetical protein
MRPTIHLWALAVCLAGLAGGGVGHGATPAASPAEGGRDKGTHRFSTLFTAQDVRDRLATDAGIDAALAWCRLTHVSKVYVEVFRDGYRADRSVLAHARDRLRAGGLEVAGCVTPTKVLKDSSGWNTVACYTDLPTQSRIQEIFEYSAALFDEVMIDDFWFTDCSCADCDLGRRGRSVVVGDRKFPVEGDTWEAYRCELMVQLSRRNVISAARRINPNVRLIIKYPQWYDRFQDRGYEVARETADFDRIWVGTETRDYADARWGGTVQYEAYFIMRWLGAIGGAKCGGGWYDWLGTTEKTYIEQARQTVLGGAGESMLFCYGGLQSETGPRNVEALRGHIPELLAVAAEVKNRQIIGVAAYKPIGSHPGDEPRVFDFVGMLGLPLVPCAEFPSNAPAAFFSMHALKDPGVDEKLRQYIRSGRPVLITDGLAGRLRGGGDLEGSNVRILAVNRDPKSLLDRTAAELDPMREMMLRPFRARLSGPNRVGLYLFGDGSWVIENFADQEAAVQWRGPALSIPGRGWRYEWNHDQSR